MWEHDKFSYADLIDKLVEIAEREHEEKNKNNYTYKSGIIQNFGMGQKNSIK